MPRAIFLASTYGLATMLCVSGHALAQQASPQPNNKPSASSTELDSVAVTAPKRYDTHQLERTIIPAFIESHGASTRIGQLARWRDDICPTTVGLPDASNDFVTARVKEIATTVGAPVKEPCEHNVQITFTTQPQKLLDQYVRRANWALGYHYASQTEELATVRHPIQAWYVTATQSSALSALAPGASGLAQIDSSYGLSPSGDSGSRLTSHLSSEFFHVLVVIDLHKVDGYELGPVSDYIAMLVLSQPQSLDDCSDLPSILDLWSPACGTRPKPLALTPADSAYLKALYDINMEARGSFERSEISMRMIKDIESH
ncbi:MAG: hypothetical protein JWR07_179 [Nevskia sp.]|nr:hypothetical protein [Nevskia sp.]